MRRDDMRQFLVVGVDGSAPSRRALAWAASVAGARNASVVAVHAHRPGQAEVRPEHAERLLAAKWVDMEQWCGDVLQGAPSRLEVVEGHPASVLVEQAETHQPATIVVAAVGASGARPGLLRLGSVAERLAHECTVPLVVVPADGATCPRRIMVAVDGSVHSQAAVHWLAEMAANLPVEVTAVTVRDTALPTVSISGEGWAADTERLLRSEWAGALNAAGVAFQTRVVEEGPVVDSLLQVADDLEADLIVIGMQGTSAISGVRIGGKALQVLHRARVTVAIVPPT